MATVKNSKKWLNDELLKKFNSFKEEITENNTNKSSSLMKWTPGERGTKEKPISYVLRLLPDKEGSFYKKFFYHMFQVNDSWKFSICPKTFNQEAFCPICSITNKLYKGTDQDKQEAQKYKRKEKFITNVYIVNDPLDKDKDDDKKVNGSVKLWEFPSKVETLIRTALSDSEDGVGINGFNPYEDGYNFILRLGATGKDANGKDWPSYETSQFARNKSNISETDSEVDEILDKTMLLYSYLKSQMVQEESVVEMLKECLVFDLIKDEYEKFKQKNKPSQIKQNIKDEDKDEDNDEIVDEIVDDEDKINKNKSSSISEIEDEDLLNELNNL